jgi:hypothetical protein
MLLGRSQNTSLHRTSFHLLCKDRDHCNTENTEFLLPDPSCDKSFRILQSWRRYTEILYTDFVLLIFVSQLWADTSSQLFSPHLALATVTLLCSPVE